MVRRQPGRLTTLHVRPSTTSRITVDDTVPARLLHDGVITEAEADTHPYRHMVIHAVGVEPTTVDVAPVLVELEAGDSIVLLSDGVSDVLDVDEIGRLVRAGATAQAAADAVADGAVDRATGDNATLVVVRHVASSTGDRARP